MLSVLIHPDSLEALFYPSPDFRCGNSHIFRTKADILLDHLSNDLIVRILKNHSRFLTDIPDTILILRVHAINPYRSLCGIQDRIDMLCKRRFAGTIMSQNGHKISLLHIQTDIVYRPRDSLYISFFITSDIFKNKIICLYNAHLSPLFPFWFTMFLFLRLFY